MGNLVLKTCVVVTALSLKCDDVKNIIPQKVLVSSMVNESLALFLHHLTWHVTNVASVGLVVIKALVLLSQTGKCIEHDTLDDVAE